MLRLCFTMLIFTWGYTAICTLKQVSQSWSFPCWIQPNNVVITSNKTTASKKVFPATSNSGLFEPLSVNVAITAKQPTLFRPEAFRINRFHCSSEAKNYPKSHGEKSIDHLPMNLLHRPTGLKRYVSALPLLSGHKAPSVPMSRSPKSVSPTRRGARLVAPCGCFTKKSPVWCFDLGLLVAWLVAVFTVSTEYCNY